MLLACMMSGASASEVCLEELRGVCIKYGTRPEVPAPTPRDRERTAPDPHALQEDALDLTRDERMGVQEGLRALGFLTGPADGVFGPGTRRAIGRWQVSLGMARTGYLTEAGRTALIEAGRKRVAEPVVPDPPAPATDTPSTLRARGQGEWTGIEWSAVLERKDRAVRLTIEMNNNGQTLRFVCDTTVKDDGAIYCPLTQTAGRLTARRYATGVLPVVEVSSEGSLGGTRFVFR